MDYYLSIKKEPNIKSYNMDESQNFQLNKLRHRQTKYFMIQLYDILEKANYCDRNQIMVAFGQGLRKGLDCKVGRGTFWVIKILSWENVIVCKLYLNEPRGKTTENWVYIEKS